MKKRPEGEREIYFETREKLQHVFRTEKLSDDEPAVSRHYASLHVSLLLALPASIVLGLIVSRVGLEPALRTTALVSIILIFFAMWKKRPPQFLYYFAFAAGIILAFTAAMILRSRMWSTLLAASFTLAAFFVYGKRPFDFYHQWLFATPGLREEDWRKLSPVNMSASFLMLCVLFSIIVIVPLLHSVTFAIVLVFLMSFAFIALTVSRGGKPFTNLRRAFRGARNIYRYYLSYPDELRFWRATDPLPKRRRIFAILWLSVALTSAIGLSYCIPFELAASWTQPGFYWRIPPDHGELGFDWLMLPFTLALTAEQPYLWALIVGLPCAFVMPYLILFTVYLPALVRAQAVADAVNEVAASDPRTTFEIYVDRLRGSTRIWDTNQEP